MHYAIAIIHRFYPYRFAGKYEHRKAWLKITPTGGQQVTYFQWMCKHTVQLLQANSYDVRELK